MALCRVYKRTARFHINRYGRNRIFYFAEVHTDNACYVVVHDNTYRACRHSELYLFLERAVTTLYERYSVEGNAVFVFKE